MKGVQRKRKRRNVVIKLGGSLMDNGRDILRFLRDYAEEKELCMIIIPGGGPFVDVVKNLSKEKDISEDAAHWMSILAMHQYGVYLANGEIPLVEGMDELNHVESMCILLPYRILKENDRLPHTWNVTSDTIAAFIANKLGEKTFLKLTDVDGIIGEGGHLIKKIRAKDVVEKEGDTCIDKELPRFLMNWEMECIIVNGNFPERIKGVIDGEETICTKLFF